MKKKVRKRKVNRLKLIIFIIPILIVIIIFMQATKVKKIDKCIVIDAGHGGVEEPGCIFNSIYERDICLAISKKLQTKLEKEYKKVIMTRESDINVYLSERCRIANKEKADIFVSIHQNALDNDNITSGIETWYNPEKDTESKILAQTIQENIIKTTNANNLGIKDSKKLIVIRDTKMPSCLVETGFLSSDLERSNLINSSYQDKIVEGIYNGIKEYFENEDNKK